MAAAKWWVPSARERLSFTEVILLHAHGYSSPNALHMTLDPRSCLGKDWENKLEITEGSEGGRELGNTGKAKSKQVFPTSPSWVRLILQPVPKLEEVAVPREESVNQLPGCPHIHMTGF